MSITGDVVRENVIGALCKKLREKIQAHPEAAQALKEVGSEMIEQEMGPDYPGFEEDRTFFKS